MAPRAHAVRLVDRKARNAQLRVVHHALERIVRALHALRRHVDQRVLAAEGARRHARIGLPSAEKARANAARGQRSRLILHQRDERRHDNHRAAARDERGDLVARRLAAAGGHEHKAVASAHDGLDDVGLSGSELGVAPVAPQRGGGRLVNRAAFRVDALDSCGNRRIGNRQCGLWLKRRRRLNRIFTRVESVEHGLLIFSA